MNALNRIFGRLIFYVASLLSFVFDLIIGIAQFLVELVHFINRGFALFIGLGGCLMLFFFAGPFALYLLLNPTVLIGIFLLVIFPILGNKFISLMKYAKYTTTEFLFDLSKYLTEGKSRRYESFFEYGHRYKREEQARRREEQRKRQEQQQKEWEQRFYQWEHFQRAAGGGAYGYGNRQQGGQSYGGFVNPMTDFKRKYEESCEILGVPYDADKYQIKLAFRKKAKEYHPDINRSDNATEMFQKINDAYEFLTEENINRYKNAA